MEFDWDKVNDLLDRTRATLNMIHASGQELPDSTEKYLTALERDLEKW